MLLFTLSVALPPSAIAQGISEAGSVVVYFFGDAECAACKRTITFVEEVIGRFNGSAVLRVFEVRYNETSRQVFMRFCSAFSLSDVQLPVVFIGEQCLHGEAETREHLAEVIDEYTAGGLTYEDTWSYVERTRESQQLAISLPVVIAAAVVDSVNPCAIGVALLLLCFAELAGSRRRLIEVGMTYVIAVYLTYFSLGLGLISVISLSGLAYLHQHRAMWRDGCGERLIKQTDVFLQPQVPDLLLAVEAQVAPFRGHVNCRWCEIKQTHGHRAVMQRSRPHLRGTGPRPASRRLAQGVLVHVDYLVVGQQRRRKRIQLRQIAT